MALNEHGAYRDFVNRLEQVVHVFLFLVIFPSVNGFAFVVGQPCDASIIHIREKRVGEWLFCLSIHHHEGILGRHNRGGRGSLGLVRLESFLLVLLAPYLTIDVLKPDIAFLIFHDLCNFLQLTNHVPGIRSFVDGIHTVDFST